MIRLCRVDSRLLHGQTVYSWYPSLRANAILIASDEVANDKVRMQVIRLAKPKDAKLVMKSLEDSIAALNGDAVDKYELIVVTQSVHDACTIAKACKKITSVNLGGARCHGEAVREIGPVIRLSQSDIDEIAAAMDAGIEFETRQVADEKIRVLTKEDL